MRLKKQQSDFLGSSFINVLCSFKLIFGKKANFNLQIFIVTTIPAGLFLSDIDWEGGGLFTLPPPFDFALGVEKGECDTCP